MNRKIEVLASEFAYQGHFKIKKIKLRYQLFSKEWSEICTREVFLQGHSVGVLLYDPKVDKLVLIEQIRMGAIVNKEENPWLLEVVAGFMEKNESITQVALRESKEEAGCEISELIEIGKFYLSPGTTAETIFIFCGIIDSRCIREGVHGKPEENEDIWLRLVPRSEAYQLLQTGKIVNATAVIALQWLELNYTKLIS